MQAIYGVTTNYIMLLLLKNISELNASRSVRNISGVTLRKFEEIINESSLKFTIKLSSNMGVPRKLIFDIIGDFQKNLVTAFVEGIRNVILPLVDDNRDKDHIEAFAEICSSAFTCTETEFKFDSFLQKSDLISSLTKFPIGVNVEKSGPLENRFVKRFNFIKRFGYSHLTQDE